MSAKDRDSFLIARRNLKMARSPEAYTRGTTRLFYNWLADTLSQSLTDPPCGSNRFKRSPYETVFESIPGYPTLSPPSSSDCHLRKRGLSSRRQ